MPTTELMTRDAELATREPIAPDTAVEPTRDLPRPERAMPVDATPTPVVTPARPRRRLRLGGRLSPLWALGTVLGWAAAVTLVSVTVPPPPPDVVRAEPAVVVLLNLAWNLAWMGALVGAAMRRRWALAVSAVGALIAFGLTVACPVSGHHETVGLWWGTHLAVFGGLTAASVAGLLRRR